MTRGLAVIDASVVVEYLVDLGLAAEATAIFARVLDDDARLQLWAPDLVYPEAASAIRKLVQRKLVTAAAGKQAVERLSSLPITASGTAALLREAWALRASITVYDACYVALARRLGAPLITSDARLARAVRGRSPVVLVGAGAR